MRQLFAGVFLPADPPDPPNTAPGLALECEVEIAAILNSYNPLIEKKCLFMILDDTIAEVDLFDALDDHQHVVVHLPHYNVVFHLTALPSSQYQLSFFFASLPNRDVTASHTTEIPSPFHVSHVDRDGFEKVVGSSPQDETLLSRCCVSSDT
ncbi:hypothetical protein GEMRC1_008781 [Eukaryota sp. GEM-RC1]